MDTPHVPPHDTLPAPPDSPPAPDYYAQLKPSYQRFVDLVARGMSHAQAYTAAGYEATRPGNLASDLIRDNPCIQAAIDQLQADLSARALLTREEYVADLKRDRDYDPVLAYESGTFTVKPLSDWPEALRKCLTGMDVSEYESEFGVRRTVKLRFVQREKVTEILGRTLGFFEQESRGTQFILIIQAPPGANEPRRVAQEIPLAPGVTLLSPPDTLR
mgnify:CR=1 FL=1